MLIGLSQLLSLLEAVYRSFVGGLSTYRSSPSAKSILNVERALTTLQSPCL